MRSEFNNINLLYAKLSWTQQFFLVYVSQEKKSKSAFLSGIWQYLNIYLSIKSMTIFIYSLLFGKFQLEIKLIHCFYFLINTLLITLIIII